MKKVVFATCRSMPDFQPDDTLIAAALEARGCTVTPAAWNESFAPFACADLIVVRSTWDYFDEAAAFEAWLQRLKTVSGVVCNAPSLMLWNSNKKYLLDLAERGAPLPPTKLSQPNAAALMAAMDELALQEAVVKPVIGAGASGLTIMQRNDPDSIERAAGALQHEGLVQPLIAEIRTLGETSCTFFDGEFSHAVIKRPETGSILVQAEHGGRTQPATLTPDQLATARSMLDLLPEPAVFARVDMVWTEPAPLLMEIEVIEPELFIRHAAPAAAHLATQLLKR
ncbi:MAG: glutathione synthase/RimK-type ligase-like ATP-grasp enzyme [Neolewinella sp.]|jgi:glutathione synthase/RimK-type ligase-like ATP-grasp enzyme